MDRQDPICCCLRCHHHGNIDARWMHQQACLGMLLHAAPTYAHCSSPRHFPDWPILPLPVHPVAPTPQPHASRVVLLHRQPRHTVVPAAKDNRQIMLAPPRSHTEAHLLTHRRSMSTETHTAPFRWEGGSPPQKTLHRPKPSDVWYVAAPHPSHKPCIAILQSCT
jgi:hypothetical protein